MAKRLPKADVVLVGFGWTASILGQELTDAGLQVLALERGGFRDTVPDFATTLIQDEVGSGFIVDPDGTIVTNKHVVSGASEVTVTLDSGISLPATVVGESTKADIAVLRVTPRHVRDVEVSQILCELVRGEVGPREAYARYAEASEQAGTPVTPVTITPLDRSRRLAGSAGLAGVADSAGAAVS